MDELERNEWSKEEAAPPPGTSVEALVVVVVEGVESTFMEESASLKERPAGDGMRSSSKESSSKGCSGSLLLIISKASWPRSVRLQRVSSSALVPTRWKMGRLLELLLNEA